MLNRVQSPTFIQVLGYSCSSGTIGRKFERRQVQKCQAQRQWYVRGDGPGTLSDVQSLCTKGASFLAACLLVLEPVSAQAVQPAASVVNSKQEGLTIKFKASRDPGVRRAQEALVEAWGYVTTQFLDPNFNGVDWQKQLQASLFSWPESVRSQYVRVGYHMSVGHVLI